jgi:hypothetical protein
MKKSALLLAVIFLCITGCKKEGNQENLCYSNTLISQVNLGNIAVHGLTYNNNCLIYESTEPYMYEKFSYDNQNRLKKVEVAVSFSAFSCSMFPGQSLESDPRKASVSQYSEFEYDEASKLIKKSNYFIRSGHTELSSYQTYDYLNDQIVKFNTFNPQGELTTYHEFKYDDRGNIIRDDLYTKSPAMKLYMTMTYEFDNKNNPYQIFAAEGDPGKYTNRNNIISQTTFYAATQSKETTTTVYEYNDLDYPVRINNLDCMYGKL